MNAVVNQILARRSRRAYEAKQISDEELETVLECGAWAPSAMNQQSWHLTALQNPELVKELSELCRVYRKIETNPFYDAPTIIVVTAKADAIAPQKDASLAMENMMLAADSLGLGTCWINCVNGLFATEEGKAFFEKIGVPAENVMVGSLALGYPKDALPAPKDRLEGNIDIIK